MSSSENINRALRIYLGADMQSGVRPYGMEERVQTEYGVNATEVLEEVRCAIDGLLEPHEAAQLASLEEIALLAGRRARSRRPELADDVCRAIGNYVSYSYK